MTPEGEVDRYSYRLVGASFMLALAGVLTQGPAGMDFLFITVDTPVWFILFVTIVPTGETLRVVRAFIRAKSPNQK